MSLALITGYFDTENFLGESQPTSLLPFFIQPSLTETWNHLLSIPSKRLLPRTLASQPVSSPSNTSSLFSQLLPLPPDHGKCPLVFNSCYLFHLNEYMLCYLVLSVFFAPQLPLFPGGTPGASETMNQNSLSNSRENSWRRRKSSRRLSSGKYQR